MSGHRNSFEFALVVTFVLIFGCAENSRARDWNLFNGNWSDPGNWNPIGTPLGGEPVNIVFSAGPGRTVTYDVNAPALGLVSIDHTLAGVTNTLSMSNNFNFTSSALFVGGYNGTGPTNGRGAVTQSAGTVTMNSGTDIVLGYGAGSTGTYTLSGTGELVARQSLFLGFSGTGTSITLPEKTPSVLVRLVHLMSARTRGPMESTTSAARGNWSPSNHSISAIKVPARSRKPEEAIA